MSKFNFTSFVNGTQTHDELIVIYINLLMTQNVEGDVIEIGCFEGSTSKFLLEYKNLNKKLFLCDTFSGIVDYDIDKDNDGISNSAFSCTYEKFIENINPEVHQDIQIISGVFPESMPEDMKHIKFSFVHLDVDTYQSTINSLNYCFPRLNIGGIITVHDYNHMSLKGVKKAVDEFVDGKTVMVDFHGHKTSQISLIKI